ncbi:MAG: sigma-54 dependent transcriptional regulator [Bryobacterales bacterium]|nr:sigma-54 dependent transcriptional regulator [Bryobacterales bacterium]
MSKPSILIIDDDESITATVSRFLRAHGYPVAVANDGADALAEARSGAHPIIISDIYIDQVTGLDVLEAARDANRNATVILMTARGSVRTTVEAEMQGAFEYVAKPFELSRLLAVIERAEAARAEPEAASHEEDLQQFGNIVGFSPAMVEVYKRIARCARSEDAVLIIGETGVGKELVARAIHEHSRRASGPFVAVDSGAVTGSLWESEVFGAMRGAFTGADRDRPGVIETARGGVVFFDEIGEIPLDFQPKLLRFLQEKEFRPVGCGAPRKADVRVIAATNRALEAMVKQGKFREDLYYRLNVLQIDVPPLRERRSDISFLVKHFLEGATAAAQKRIWLTAEAISALEQYTWPGNVRQLQNTISKLVALSPPGPVSVADVREAIAAAPVGPGDETGTADEEEISDLDELERRQILRVLEETGGNKTRAAEILGIQRRTLYKKLARMGREDGGQR